MRELRNAYIILVEKPKEMVPLGRCMWEDNVRMGLGEIRWEGVEWMHLAQYRVQWWISHEHGYEPLGFIKGREFCDWLDDS